jgi:hypothetical protein
VTQLDVAGSRLAVRVAATAASTPALPGGGPFVVVPAWAASRLTLSVAPNTMLLMGAGINITDLRAVAAHVLPGSQVTSRTAVLQAAAGQPLLRGGPDSTRRWRPDPDHGGGGRPQRAGPPRGSRAAAA